MQRCSAAARPLDKRQTGALAECLESSDLRALLRAPLISLGLPALIIRRIAMAFMILLLVLW